MFYIAENITLKTKIFSCKTEYLKQPIFLADLYYDSDIQSVFLPGAQLGTSEARTICKTRSIIYYIELEEVVSKRSSLPRRSRFKFIVFAKRQWSRHAPHFRIWSTTNAARVKPVDILLQWKNNGKPFSE